MKLVRLSEHRYICAHLRAIRHLTLDPRGPGVIRIHMVPPDTTWNRSVPYLLILNGQDILPIGLSWAIMLSCFIDEMEPYAGRELTADEWNRVVHRTVSATSKVYPSILQSDIRKELDKLLDALEDVARGKQPAGRLRVMSLSDYAPHMTAPHRIDLMVSAMTVNGSWNCNQKCLHCYAAGQPGAETKELSTAEWKRILDACRRACIPQVTFTGGEPTMREDLPELIRHAEWFVTRLNTNGRRLTPELCQKLYDASLDSVQITLYSSEKEIHNRLVGAPGFEETVAGIRNALAAGLNVSVNTPLCSLNCQYDMTLNFLHKLGVRYVTCSGLIPSGNALADASAATALSGDEMKKTLAAAVAVCQKNGMEISFTSPGWLDSDELLKLGLLQVPACGACLSNMAVRPDGVVVPCQSWLSGEGLGNLLFDKWAHIWNHPVCRSVREKSAGTYYHCQLRESNHAPAPKETSGGKEKTL